jgi:hypothetical protein
MTPGGTLTIGDLTFTLRFSDRRRTVGVTVDRGGDLFVTAPLNTPRDRIEAVVRSKTFWVYTKLAVKEKLLRQAPPREYASGESFYHLGRSYRLKLVDAGGGGPPLRLVHGRFLLERSARSDAAGLFRNWYGTHGRPWIERRVQLYADRLALDPQPVEVRDLGYRWGSCSSRGKLLFHWRTVLLPPRIIEYVVAHELTHLLHPQHDLAFWRALSRCMPDYVARKEWLSQMGSQFQ